MPEKEKDDLMSHIINDNDILNSPMIIDDGIYVHFSSEVLAPLDDGNKESKFRQDNSSLINLLDKLDDGNKQN